MKTYKKLYSAFCTSENLKLAFRKARKNKTSLPYVISFQDNLQKNLEKLQEELINHTYQPKPLKKFIIRDPKTRTIHASNFRDRIVYHALVNIIEPIYEKIFIYDSYASRKNKGAHKAVARFDNFKKKVSKNGKLLKKASNKNQVLGYAFKADIKHYFETVDHEILISIVRRKIHDENIIWILRKILENFETNLKGKGMPLGNLTSQFFANVYLNELDHFVKGKLKAKYYIRYVDDFVILDSNKQMLLYYKNVIDCFLKNHLLLELHPAKSKIIPLSQGISFLGYKIFYKYKRLRKTNRKAFARKFQSKIDSFQEGAVSYDQLLNFVLSWFSYAKWANTYRLRKKIIQKINKAKAESENADSTKSL